MSSNNASNFSNFSPVMSLLVRITETPRLGGNDALGIVAG
jgi:hypothetical protein